MLQLIWGLNSLGKGLKTNVDGSVDIYFAPRAPRGQEANWIQTIPGKTWRPSELEFVE